MFPKRERVSGADIQKLLRHGKKVYGSHFVFVYLQQPRQRSFHQISIQIPVKLDKRATVRNLLKRHALIVIETLLNEYYLPPLKIFLFVNKKHLEPLRELVARGEKTTIVGARKTLVTQDFIGFLRRVGTDPHGTACGKKYDNFSNR